MKRALAFGVLLLAPLLLVARSPQNVGVVVERVDKGSAPDRAGIHVGDILISWERAANPPANPTKAKGVFRTPIDVEEVAADEAERGALTLHGTRNGEKRTFKMPSGKWDVFDEMVWRAEAELSLHPVLAGKTHLQYLRGLELIRNKQIESGVSLWKGLAHEWNKSEAFAEATWIRLRAGTTLAHAQMFDQAQSFFDAALASANAGAIPGAAQQIWVAKAVAYSRQRKPEQAADAVRQILSICAGNSRASLWAARALALLGKWSYRAVKPAEAASLSRQSAEIAERAAPGNLSVAKSLSELAASELDLDDLEAAEEHGRAALAIVRRLQPGDQVFQAIMNLGIVLLERGDLAGAEALFRENLTIAQAYDPESIDIDTAFTLGNLGTVAFRRGDLNAARNYHLRDLKIEEKVSFGSGPHAAALDNLGDVAMALGDFAAAEDIYKRELELQERQAPDSLGVTYGLDSLGLLAIRRGNPTAAQSFFSRALEIQERLSPGGLGAATSLDGLGDVAAARGDLVTAQHFYEQSLAIRERLAPESQYFAETLHSLGLAQRRMGHLPQAESSLSRAIDVLESQKRKLGGTQDVKARFGASYADYYRDYIEVLLELNRREDAFKTLERSRARSLLSMLAERDLVFAADVPKELERQQKLTAAEYDRTQDEIKELNPKVNAQEIEDSLGRLKELRQTQGEIAEKIKQASPHYASLRYPQPLDIGGTRAVLDPGAVLLSYSVGKEKSQLFVVVTDPKAGPPLSVFTLPVGEKALRESVQALRKLIEWNKTSSDLLSRSQSLYKTLLEPAEALIGKADRILILPDGPLHTLPWAALIRGVQAGKAQYLVEWKPIHTAVSATVYAELKKSRREGSNNPAIQVAAFGDPRYPALVARKTAVKRGDGTEETEEDGHADPQVNAVLRGGYKFQPLPRSRQEVEAIASLYAPKSEAYLGEQATEERAKSIGKDVRLIHYACHAYVNELLPLDSALVFTIPEKPKEGQDNGLLQAWEIFEKVRIDADLVTLSACESGLGKEMGGEGLIGLTRAFQYAGARSILASLWKVEDESTGELMKRFYQYLKSGKTKDEALGLAQIDLIHSPGFSQPIHWAAFELIGDWK